MCLFICFFSFFPFFALFRSCSKTSFVFHYDKSFVVVYFLFYFFALLFPLSLSVSLDHLFRNSSCSRVRFSCITWAIIVILLFLFSERGRDSSEEKIIWCFSDRMRTVQYSTFGWPKLFLLRFAFVSTCFVHLFLLLL